MKIPVIILWLSFIACPLCAQNQEPAPLFDTRTDCSAKHLATSLLKGTKSNAGNNYDIYYHRFQWTVDPEIRYITGRITTYLKITGQDVQQITFDMSDTLQVDSIMYHGTILSYTLSDNILTVNLPALLQQGQTDSLTVYYQGVPRISDQRAFATGVHDTAGTPVPVLWTLSQPYGALEWWPCKQNLSDKIDSADIFVTTPDTYKTASNGLLVSETDSAGMRTCLWKHRYPIDAYLIAIAVTDYADSSFYIPLENGDSVYLLNYYYPEDASFIGNSYKVIPVIQLYSHTFIPYPFINEKYGHAQFNWHGGMEHQTMAFMYHLSHALTAHELGHQWFGDYITCGSWQDIWLNEGFADFCLGLTYEKMFDGYYWPYWKEEIISYVTSEPGGSVFCTDTTDVGRIFSNRLSYKKGSLLLHMLHWELGDSVFYDAIRSYLNDTALAFGYARTENLVHHLETTADTNLTEFFNDWFYGEGYPMYTIQWNQDAYLTVSLSILQTTSHTSVDFFEMTVPVGFYGQGTDTVTSFRHLYSGQEYTFNPGFVVDSLYFDPEMWIITRDPVIEYMSVKESGRAGFSIYPNPVKESLTVVLPEGVKTGGLELRDNSGRKLLNVEIKNSEPLLLSASGLSSGLYYLVYRSDNVTITGSFVRE
ncbi:MAG: M1 family metallopeptidase [Bacteroidetes bacterium]|nr:M1 family metallopeptidase [Bacteroidota bacterium]